MASATAARAGCNVTGFDAGRREEPARQGVVPSAMAASEWPRAAASRVSDRSIGLVLIAKSKGAAGFPVAPNTCNSLVQALRAPLAQPQNKLSGRSQRGDSA